MRFLFSIVAFSSLAATARAGCAGFGTVAGDLVTSRYKDQFYYPGAIGGPESQLDDLQRADVFFPSVGGIFKNDGVDDGSGGLRDYEYRDDEDNQKGNKFTISDKYSGVEETFKNLCEETWACTQFNLQFAAARSNDVDYKPRAVCFDDDYYLDLLDVNEDKKEFTIRENYIVDTCWGGRKDTNDANTIQDLEELRDSICNAGDALVDQLLFDIGDSAQFDDVRRGVCRNAVNCIRASQEGIFVELDSSGILDSEALMDVLEDEDMSEIYSDTGDVTFEICFEKTVEEINETLNQCEEFNSGGAACAVPTFPNRTGPPGCGDNEFQGAFPICPLSIFGMFEDFGPAYPNKDSDIGYRIATASIRSIFIPCELDRTSADAVGLILFLRPIFASIELTTEQIKDALPEDFQYAAFVIINGIFKIITLALEIVLEQADYHDALVQGAELEALYENTRQLLNASAAIYDEVVCRCVETLKKGHGCDSVDNDCDDVVDDCTEDTWKPEIHVDTAIAECSNRWFQTAAEAFSCVRDLVSVMDDCDESLALSDGNFTRVGTCADSSYSIVSADKCGNDADTKTVPVLIDDEAPATVSCSFDGASGTQLSLTLDRTGANVMEDVGLQYNATDGCGEDVEVQVEVYSSEIEDFQSQQMAILFQDSKPNDAVGLYVAKGVCSTSSNGQCIKDTVFPDNRIYTVVIKTTDVAGFTSETECSIVIVPQNQRNPIDVTQSTQRFLLASYNSTFSA